MKTISRIVIDFAASVELADDMQQAIVKLASIVCDDYERAHPDRVMWPFGIGQLPTYIPMTREEEEAGRHLEFDETVFSVDCHERERYADSKPSPRARATIIRHWRSMKTVPTDGASTFLAATADGRMMIWRGDILAVAMKGGTPKHLQFPAIAWMPLPETPQ